MIKICDGAEHWSENWVLKIGERTNTYPLKSCRLIRWFVLCFVVPWNKRQKFYVQCLFYCHRYGKQASANHFEESTGPIWLDDVNCSGKETSFLQCSRRPWGRHDCSHWEDVAISCYPGRDGHRLSLGEVLPQLLSIRISVATAPLSTGLECEAFLVFGFFFLSVSPNALIFNNLHSEKNSLLSLSANVINFYS